MSLTHACIPVEDGKQITLDYAILSVYICATQMLCLSADTSTVEGYLTGIAWLARTVQFVLA